MVLALKFVLHVSSPPFKIPLNDEHHAQMDDLGCFSYLAPLFAKRPLNKENLHKGLNHLECCYLYKHTPFTADVPAEIAKQCVKVICSREPNSIRTAADVTSERQYVQQGVMCTSGGLPVSYYNAAAHPFLTLQPHTLCYLGFYASLGTPSLNNQTRQALHAPTEPSLITSAALVGLHTHLSKYLWWSDLLGKSSS